MRAVAELPALKTGCRGMFDKWKQFNGFRGFGLVGLIVSNVYSRGLIRGRISSSFLTTPFYETLDVKYSIRTIHF